MQWENFLSFEDQTTAQELNEKTPLLKEDQGNDQFDANKKDCSSAYATDPSV